MSEGEKEIIEEKGRERSVEKKSGGRRMKSR
jgi:hypothetical protein